MEYYINIDNEKRGPYSIKELAERGIEATTLVLPADSNDWTPAWQIEELRAVLMGNLNNNAQQTGNKDNVLECDAVVDGEPVNEIPHVEARPIADAYVEEATPEKHKKQHGCLIGILVSLVAFVCLLIFTCPSAEEHKRVLSDVVTSTVNDAATAVAKDADNDIFSKALQTVNDVFTKKVVDAAMDNLISVDNYFVCSVGKVHFGGKSYIVSLGVLNHVFTLNKEQLKLAMEKYYKKAEIDVQSELQKEAEKLLKENVIAPAADKIKEMAGSAVDELLDDLGFSSKRKSSDANSGLPEDSI